MMKTSSDITNEANGWNRSRYSLFDEVPFIVAVLEADHAAVTYVNKSMLNFCGQQYEEVTRQITEQVALNPDADVGSNGRSFFTNDNHFEKKAMVVKISIAGKLGTKYLDVSLHPLRDEKGKVAAMLMTGEDVTEKHETELQILAQQVTQGAQVERGKLLRANEEINRLFIEYAPAAMAMFDTQMNYIAVSKQWMKDYGLQGTVIGKNQYEIFPNIPQRWKAANARCMKGEVIKCDEDYIKTKKGIPIWLKWETHPWYNTENEIGGIVIFAEDITERKRAEKRVQESEERFRSMASEAPLFVWVTDEKLQTTFLNKAGLEFFNIDESLPLEALSWKKFIHPDDLPAVLMIMHDAAALHEPYTCEMRLKNGQTGQYRWFLDKGVPRYCKQTFTGFIGTSLDIHDRKETEAILDMRVKARTKEIEEKNAELEQMIERLHRHELLDEQKNDFIAMASHELKTPITSIKGYVQLLLTNMGQQKDEKPLPALLLRSSLLSMDKQLRRLTRLISELLDVSKIEAGRLELKNEKFSFNELAIETIQDILFTNPEYNIRLYHDYEGYVFADKDRIQQVMINFLTNAIKYSRTDKTIEVTIRRMEDHEIGYTVKDKGIGIDKDEQLKIFDKFYRVKGKTEQTFPGFGIGLFVAKEFVTRQGGRIMVESEKHQGTSFTFTLQIVTDNL